MIVDTRTSCARETTYASQRTSSALSLHPDSLDHLLEEIAAGLLGRSLRLATAESCTGGLLASTLTEHAGCSEWFEGGFVSYRLSAKTRLLDIASDTLERYHPVSREIALLMARHTLDRTEADFAISTTGLAGPDGDGTDVPVGTLWIAWECPELQIHTAEMFELHGDRHAFREKAVLAALQGLDRLLQG